MAGTINLRGMRRALNQLMTCPTCGKQRMVKATAHNQTGAATEFEDVIAARHCTCADGPVALMGETK